MPDGSIAPASIPALRPTASPGMTASEIISEHVLRRTRCVRIARATDRVHRAGGHVRLAGGAFEAASTEILRVLSFVVNHGVALDASPEEQARALGLLAMARSAAQDTIEAEHDPRWMRRSAAAVELLERVVDDYEEAGVVRWAARVAMLAFVDGGAIIRSTCASMIVEATERFLDRKAVRVLLDASTGGIGYPAAVEAWLDERESELEAA
jgi:hypothetical protein